MIPQFLLSDILILGMVIMAVRAVQMVRS